MDSSASPACTGRSSIDAQPANNHSVDELLTQAVNEAVRARCGQAIANFTAIARHGVVTLHGLARSFYQKQVMLNTVFSVKGVAQVVDQVEVLPLEPRRYPGGLASSEIYHAA